MTTESKYGSVMAFIKKLVRFLYKLFGGHCESVPVYNGEVEVV